MTAVYDRLGLKFLYPENWKLIDESESDAPQPDAPNVITLETPGGGSTWSVHVYPVECDEDAVLKTTISSLQETYEDLEIEPHTLQIGQVEAKGVEAMFYCLDFLIRAQLHLVRTPEYVFLFWSQAEDRDFEKQQIVFQAIAISLLSSVVDVDGQNQST